jgi:hypothetical protein
MNSNPIQAPFFYAFYTFSVVKSSFPMIVAVCKHPHPVHPVAVYPVNPVKIPVPIPGLHPRFPPIYVFFAFFVVKPSPVPFRPHPVLILYILSKFPFPVSSVPKYSLARQQIFLCANRPKTLLSLRFVRWCNGSTRPFGGLCHGSNPCRTAIRSCPLPRCSK